nr:MAG TPA: hypothetical protein [Caudoviricetes sp.]
MNDICMDSLMLFVIHPLQVFISNPFTLMSLYKCYSLLDC